MIMDNVRLKLTENEKLAQSIVGLDGNSIHMSENSIDKVLEKEKASKFNEELEKYVEEYKEHNKALAELGDKMGTNPEKLEIKPLTDHVLIKPYKQNPFQKMEIQNGIIVDTGGFQMNVAKNPISGKMEEQEQIICTGVIVEVGPTVKYLQVGDVIFYHRRNIVPVPFFKQGFYDIAEYQVLAVVNEGLQERFNNIK